MKLPFLHFENLPRERRSSGGAGHRPNPYATLTRWRVEEHLARRSAYVQNPKRTPTVTALSVTSSTRVSPIAPIGKSPTFEPVALI